jgi:thiosulfate/3-mercaptopyruvate sulfurtransferase
MTYTSIISTHDLADHLNDPHWVIIDCRFNLAQPEWGHQSYLEQHISGAVFADLDQHLSSPKTNQSGRHPLPDLDQLAEQCSRWGIDENTQVVVYDAAGGSFAGRLWWLLRVLGHKNVAVLDGSLQKWLHENRPVASGEEIRPAAAFHAHINPALWVDAETVDRIRQNPDYVLIDARAPERYSGETEPIDAIGGHIPGAVNRFHGNNLSSEGTFLTPEVLRTQFLDLLGDVPSENAIVYCGSGVTSIHHLVAMELAGLTGARLYPGSWSEWIRDPNRPIANGS